MSSSSSVFLVLIVCVILYYLQMYIVGDKCHSEDRIDGKVVIVTGANNGIGLETSRQLVERGGTVIMACRNADRCAKAVEDVATTTKQPKNVRAMNLDLGSFMSIRGFVAEFKENYKRLDILVNNAGILHAPPELTADGFEQTMGVNHLGHFLLTNLLVPVMLESKTAGRIVTLSSQAHRLGSIDVTDPMTEMGEVGWHGMTIYSRSKLANNLFSYELSKKLKDTNIKTYAVSPGMVNTGFVNQSVFSRIPYMDTIISYGEGYFIRGPSLGAATGVCCAVDKEIGKSTGKYYHNCVEYSPSSTSTDDKTAEALWDHSVKLTNLESKELKWMK